MSTFAIFCGQNVRGPNIQAEMSVAKMSVAEMCSAEMCEHRTFMAELLLWYCAINASIKRNGQSATTYTLLYTYTDIFRWQSKG